MVSTRRRGRHENHWRGDGGRWCYRAAARRLAASRRPRRRVRFTPCWRRHFAKSRHVVAPYRRARPTAVSSHRLGSESLNPNPLSLSPPLARPNDASDQRECGVDVVGIPRSTAHNKNTPAYPGVSRRDGASLPPVQSASRAARPRHLRQVFSRWSPGKPTRGQPASSKTTDTWKP